MRALTIAALLATALVARPAEAAEICGDLADNDNDNLADEQCDPSFVSGVCESPLSCGLTGAVAPVTGQLVYREPPDLDPRVPWGPPLTFQRVFMSQVEENAGGFPSIGIGWRHNWHSWLDLVRRASLVSI